MSAIHHAASLARDSALAPGLWFLLLALPGLWLLRRLDGDLPRRVAAGALGLTLAVLAGPLFAGRILASPGLDELIDAAPADGRVDPEAVWRRAAFEPALRVFPEMVEVRRALRRGELPFWNPSLGAGVPLLASPEAQAAQPLVLAAWPLAPGPALGVTAALQVLLALVFGWLALRDLDPGEPMGEGPAFAGAAAYAFGGVLPAHGWPGAHVAALFPALLYALGVAERRGRRRDLVLVGAVAVTLLVAGSPASAVVALAAGLAYLVARSSRRPTAARLRPFGLALAAVLLAAGLAAPVLLPTLRWLPKTEALAFRDADRLEVLRRDSFGLMAMRDLWHPPVRGYEAEVPWGRLALGGVLFLAALAVVAGPFRRRGGAVKWVIAGAGLIGLAATSRPPPLAAVLDYLRLSPLEPEGGPAGFLLHFALAWLAAWGLAAVAGPWRRRPRGAAVLVAALVAAAALWAVSAAAGSGRPSLPALGVIAASAIAALGRAGALPIVGLLMTAEAAMAAVPGSVARADFFPPRALIAALGDVAATERGYRAVTLDARLPPGAPAVYGLHDPRGLPGRRPAIYVHLIRPLEGRPAEWTLRDHPLYDPLAVRAVLPAGRFEPLHRPTALPVLYLPAEASPVAGGDWADQVRAAAESRTAVFAPEPGRDGAWRAASPGRVRLAVGPPGATRVRARVELPEERLLASSVYQDGGWRVLLDGRPVPATLAAGPFVAAWLPVGSHRVELVYRPPGLTAGLAVAALSFVVAAGGLFVAGRRNRASVPG